MASIYEELGGTYHLGADGFYYPDLLPLEEDTPACGKYGRLRRRYLKEHREGLYTGLLLSGKLNAHLNEIDAAANAQMELISKQMAAAQDITEELKARDQMAWVGTMENVRGAAEEIILNELIYSYAQSRASYRMPGLFIMVLLFAKVFFTQKRVLFLLQLPLLHAN